MPSRWKLSLASCLLALSTGISTAVACPGHEGGAPPAKQQPAKKPATVALRVERMHCQGCSDKVKALLQAADGVVKVDVKLDDRRVVVDYDAEKLSPEKIAKIVTDAGYPASVET